MTLKHQENTNYVHHTLRKQGMVQHIFKLLKYNYKM